MKLIPTSEHNGDEGRYIMLLPTGEVKWGYYVQGTGWTDRNNYALSEPEFICGIETESEQEERNRPSPISIWDLAPSREYKYFAIGRSGKGKFFTHEPFRLANGEWTRLGATSRETDFRKIRLSESKEYEVDAKLLETADIPCDCTRFHIGRSSGR